MHPLSPRGFLSIAFALAVLFILVACGPSEPSRQEQEDDIRETVFRYQFERNLSILQDAAIAYCLSLNADSAGDGPQDAFLERFSEDTPPVKKASACSSENLQDGVRDIETGERAIIFRITNIEWLSDNEVKVQGGYLEASLSTSGNVYLVVKGDGQWSVRDDLLVWVS